MLLPNLLTLYRSLRLRFLSLRSLKMLKFNYNLQTQEERAQFVSENESSLSTIRDAQLAADYILWGGKGEGDFKLRSRWSQKEPESLEALLERPTFSEAALALPPSKTPHQNLDREFERSRSDPQTLETLESLWSQIDEIELKLNFWELKTGKRQNPPRPSLLGRVSPYIKARLQSEAEALTPQSYNSLKALLVELRQTQYTLRDSYAAPHMVQSYQIPVDIDVPIDGLPSGLKRDDTLSSILFNLDPLPNPFIIPDPALLMKRIWRTQDPTSIYIDFRDLETLHYLITFREELKAADSNTDARFISDTLEFYIEFSNLEPSYREILDFKSQKLENQRIRLIINQKYGKNYSENYISTIYRQKILKAISEAVESHRRLLENLVYPENFKRCNTCGRLLLETTDNFMKKAKSSTGYNGRCKKCEKEKRQAKKGDLIFYEK